MKNIFLVTALLAGLALAGAAVTAQETPTKPAQRQMGPMMGQGGQMGQMGNMGAMMKMMQGMMPMMEQCRQMMGGTAPSEETDQR